MKLQQTPPLPVIFRKYRIGGQISAWFPTLSTSQMYRDLCAVYEHIGQHGAGSIRFIGAHTVPATEEEYAPLLRELTDVCGYENLQVCQRITPQMNEARYANQKEYAK